MPAPVSTRYGRWEPCAICETPVYLDAATTDDPECPEMIHSQSGRAWFGIVAEDGKQCAMCIVCGDDCLRRLLHP